MKKIFLVMSIFLDFYQCKTALPPTWKTAVVSTTPQNKVEE